MAQQFERLKTALADRYAIERELGSGGMASGFLPSYATGMQIGTICVPFRYRDHITAA